MADWPINNAFGRVFRQSGGVLTANASNNVKGSYATCVASASEADGLLIAFRGVTATRMHLIDVAFGAAASEVNVLENYLFSSDLGVTQWVYLPIQVPAGTRISARVQSSTGSTTFEVNVHAVRGSFYGPPPGGRVVTLGANTADSGGTLVDCGATAFTAGAYSQLSASTTADISAILVVTGNNLNTSATFINFLLDISVGAGGSEITILSQILFVTSGSTFGTLPSMWLPCSIPAGSRVSARASCGTNNATDRQCDVVVYGLVA